MRKIFLLLALLLFYTSLNAKALILPREIMKYNYPNSEKIVKKNILLNSKEAKNIQKLAKVKLKRKIFKVFKAIKNNNIQGYGILIKRKVRSKNVVVLYIINTNHTLKSMEIVAFNEPIEYKPSQKWSDTFKDKRTNKNLRAGKEITTITGATLSARAITDGSRLAFAFYNEILKDR